MKSDTFKARSRREDVLPVCNRQPLLCPNCQLQTGSTLARTLPGFFALALLFAPRSVLACSVCFGGDSKLTEGMHAGVLVLLLIVVAVLGGFAAFFIFLARRAAAAAALEANSTESKA